MNYTSKINQKELLSTIYELYQHKMYAVAYSILHSVEQAEDVVQDSFLKLVHYLPKIDKPESVKTKRLIIRILKTTAIDQYRKNSKNQKATEENIDNNIIPLQSIEEKTFIHNILNELHHDYLEVVKLRCYYGFSCKETAKILSISEANVCKRMERARKQILSKLEEEDLKHEGEGLRSNLNECWKRNTGKTI